LVVNLKTTKAIGVTPAQIGPGRSGHLWRAYTLAWGPRRASEVEARTPLGHLLAKLE